MRVLGLSFGRKNGHCDTAVKEALLGAKAAGAEIRFINTVNLRIDRCTGCRACHIRRESGGPSRCTKKDDFPFVENEILDADAMIIAAPVYVLGPVGQYKNLCDRMGPPHDRASMVEENKRRASLGMERLDERLFKDRFLGLVSVGGAVTENWTSFGLSGLHLLTFSMQMTVVDQLNLYGMGERVSLAFDPELLARLFQMGKSVTSVIGTPRLEAPFFGEEEGICPLCHCDLLTVKGTTDVQCAVCGMHGTLKLEGDKVSVSYPAGQIERARPRYGGVEDHHFERAEMKELAAARLAKDGNKLPDLLRYQAEIKEVDKSGFVENMEK